VLAAVQLRYSRFAAYRDFQELCGDYVVFVRRFTQGRSVARHHGEARNLAHPLRHACKSSSTYRLPPPRRLEGQARWKTSLLDHEGVSVIATRPYGDATGRRCEGA